MLVSPLMGPIVRLGLGITTLDHRRAASAALALLAGMGIALLMSITIVWISPVRELTAEILARTRPNLFDLLVATLSGLAGGYAMVRGRGGTIVGVAIATALMPPMAVVGFGIASGHAPVAQGALLLFATNLVAIALSITAVTCAAHSAIAAAGAPRLTSPAPKMPIRRLSVPARKATMLRTPLTVAHQRKAAITANFGINSAR